MKNQAQSTICAIVALTFIAAVQTVCAQGTAFTYQGRLNDGSGPATGIYDLRFTIYDAATDGNVYGALTNAATPVTNGLFTVTLDFGAGIFNGADRWLDIGVRTNGASDFTMLASRQPVTSTPYAIQALNAARATTAASANSVAAANITGTLSAANLPSTVLTNGAAGVNLFGTFSGTFSGDGSGLDNLDLHSVNTHDMLSWITNMTFSYSASFQPLSTNYPANPPYDALAVDVNGDGKVDLVSICGDWGVDTLTVLTNNGYGSFIPAETNVAGWKPVSVAAADVNGDGFPDLITANNNQNTLTVMTNDGTGHFVLSSSPDAGPAPGFVTAADVNRDGKMDLICANQWDNTLTVLTNAGAGGFVLSSTLPTGNSPVFVLPVDLNRDGWVDLVCANYYGHNLTVFTNDGAGGFGVAATVPSGQTPNHLVTADINHDGWPDVICANQEESYLTVLTNNGSGGLGLSVNYPVAWGSLSVAVADVNLDGWADLIYANENDNTLTVLTNDTHGNFALSATIPNGRVPLKLLAADVNGDGRADVICANKSDNSLTVYSQAHNPHPDYMAGINAGTINAGTLPVAQLPAVVVTNNASGLNLSGAFTGDGSGLSNLTFSVTGDLTGQRLNIGVGNTLSGDQSSIAGGLNNTVSADYATIGGGRINTASAVGATVVGGVGNAATNRYATVAGGNRNTAGAEYSFAAGFRAKALHRGSFVWSAPDNTDFTSTSVDQFLIRAPGGVGINTNDTSGAALTVAGTIKADNIFQWEVAAGTTVQAQPNTGYIANNADPVTVTLPASPNVGDTVRVTGSGAGGWTIAQNAGQFILIGNLGSLSNGLTWTAQANSSARNWTSVASSADGTKLVAEADRIYTSTDSGVTWTPRDSAVFSGAVASSADGTKLVATSGDGHFYTSTDSGATWTPRGSNNCTSVASSADGAKLVAAARNGQIYTSTDLGVTWTPRESNRNWNSVASSSDGTKLVASADQIYTSTDSGVTWTPRGGTGLGAAVASSSDGSRLVAGDGTAILVSIDSGVTWKLRVNLISSLWYFQSVASSADGRKLVAVARHGQIYTSTDSGVTWTWSESGRVWNSVASSADGCKLAAAASSDTIYTTSFGYTTVGPAGGLSGGQRTAVELQYIGNQQFMPISYVGTVLGY